MGEAMNWDLILNIRIPGPGVAMGRPRFNRYSGRAHTPEKTRKYLWLVQAIQEKACHGMDLPIPRDTPIRISIEAVYKRPGTRFRRKDPDHALWKTTKPDIDNVCKSILDGLQGLWVDDAQVCDIHAIKVMGAIVDRKSKTCELERVDVRVWTGDPSDEPC